jgi:hypothetical protein
MGYERDRIAQFPFLFEKDAVCACEYDSFGESDGGAVANGLEVAVLAAPLSSDYSAERREVGELSRFLIVRGRRDDL